MTPRSVSAEPVVMQTCVVCQNAYPRTPAYFAGRFDLSLYGLRYRKVCLACDKAASKHRKQRQRGASPPSSVLPVDSAAAAVSARPATAVEHLRHTPKGKKAHPFDVVLAAMEKQYGPYASWHPALHREHTRRVAIALQQPDKAPPPEPEPVVRRDPADPLYRPPVSPSTR